nr:ATPase domain-containing protein [Candidatus Njordarchaeum guaymaensis]
MADQMSFGINEVDKLMGGGMLPGNSYLMETGPGTEELAFAAAFLNEGLRQGNVCGILLFDMPHENMISKLADFGVNARKALDSEAMVIADLWSEGKYDPERRGPILLTDNLTDPNSALRLYYDLAELNEKRLRSGKFTGSRLVVYSISSQIMNYKIEATYKLDKIGVNMIRQAKVLSLAVIDPEMFDETVVAAFEHMNDGIIVLTMKEVKGKFQRFFRVKQSPIGGFYTDEVPYEIVDNRPALLTPLTEPTVSFSTRAKFHADGSISMAGSRFMLTNVMVPNILLEQAMTMLGHDTAAKEVYNLYKKTGQAEIKTLLSSLNVSQSRSDPKQLLKLYASYLSNVGLGMIELVRFTNDLVTYRVRNSLCSQGQRSEKPMAPYLAGTFAGAVEVILGRLVKCTEIKCMAKGDDYCEFECRETAR